MSDRSAKLEVRNPLLALPAARTIARLPAEMREPLVELLRELAADAAGRAEESWRKKKAPMAYRSGARTGASTPARPGGLGPAPGWKLKRGKFVIDVEPGSDGAVSAIPR